MDYAHTAARDAEQDRCRSIAAIYKRAGYLSTIPVALFVAAPAVIDMCGMFLAVGSLALILPVAIVLTVKTELARSHRREWETVHYNKWTGEVLPPWPGYREFLRVRELGADAERAITGARMHLIVALREVYDYVMKRGKGQGGGGASEYDFSGWESSLERLEESVTVAVSQADLSPGQTQLVDAAAAAARVARKSAADLATRSGKGARLRDHVEVWVIQWKAIDAVARARQSLGDECPESDLEDIRKRLEESGAV